MSERRSYRGPRYPIGGEPDHLIPLGWYVLALFALILFLIVWVISFAWMATAHAAPPPWTTTLLQPATGTSCGPCRTVLTKFRDPTYWDRLSGWQAQVNGAWTPILPSLVVLTRRPLGLAVLCEADGRLTCYVPPLVVR